MLELLAVGKVTIKAGARERKSCRKAAYCGAKPAVIVTLRRDEGRALTAEREEYKNALTAEREGWGESVQSAQGEKGVKGSDQNPTDGASGGFVDWKNDLLFTN